MSMDMNGIIAVIVTYNRKDDLLRCLKAVMNQSHAPQGILVIDNASTDGTLEHLKTNGIVDERCEPGENDLVLAGATEACAVWYCRRPYNTGGSGGFHMGMKLAIERLGASYCWLMDDDGYPELDCLECLIQKAGEYDFIMPISIDMKRRELLSWVVRKRNGKKTARYDELVDSWGDIVPYVTPFNGTLLSKRCVTNAGYVDERFFLWGDEYEYYWRCKENGIVPVSVTRARFYHPAQKLPMVPVMMGMLRVPYVDSPFRMVCLARNYTYIYLHYHQIYKIPAKLMLYSWLFLITRHGDFAGWRLYLLSVRDGIKGDFSRHWKYLS